MVILVLNHAFLDFDFFFTCGLLQIDSCFKLIKIFMESFSNFFASWEFYKCSLYYFFFKKQNSNNNTFFSISLWKFIREFDLKINCEITHLQCCGYVIIYYFLSICLSFRYMFWVDKNLNRKMNAFFITIIKGNTLWKGNYNFEVFYFFFIWLLFYSYFKIANESIYFTVLFLLFFLWHR